MENIFQKAQPKRVFQDVVGQIQEAILNGEIPIGDRLPPERELCEMFAASRGTLREALRILEQKGLIEIRLGSSGGAYVRGANAELMAESLDMLIHSSEISLLHLAEFREGVEGTVCALAAKRASEEDCKKLSDLLAQATACFEKGIEEWENFVRVDEKIHMIMADIAENPLYAVVLRSVHDNIHRYYDKFLQAGPNEFEENYKDLKQIIAAVIAHDEDAAKAAACDHIQRFNEHMKKKERN